MYMSPLNNICFKGETRYLCCNSEGKNKTVGKYLYGKSYFGDTRNLSNMIERRITDRKIAVEETIGKNHDNPTYKVYIADPEEKIGDIIRMTHDYVVYDTEPSYPDIFKEDLELLCDRTIKKQLNFIKSYLERLEAVKLENGIDTQSEEYQKIKDKQSLIKQCLEKYKKIEELQNMYLEISSDIIIKKNKMSALLDEQTSYQKELPIKNKLIERKLNAINNNTKLLKYWQEQKTTSADKKHLKFVKIGAIDTYIEAYIKKIQRQTEALSNYRIRIQFIEKRMNDIPALITKIENIIKKYTQKIEEIKKEIAPEYNILRDFYNEKGIKLIKKV